MTHWLKECIIRDIGAPPNKKKYPERNKLCCKGQENFP